MIFLNAMTDSNDSAISYSSMSLSSSPVKTESIQQLLESPLIKAIPLKTNLQNIDKVLESDSDLDANEDEVLVPETPDITPVGSQETDPLLATDLPQEVESSQSSEDNISETNTQNNGRNSLRRQTSVCVSNANSSVTSSPRAMAILKNAIKTSFNSNKLSDKTMNSNNTNGSEDVKPNLNDMNGVNGVNSQPNNKLFTKSSFRNSPLSRGSALLKRAKERIEKQELDRSPKFSYNQILIESNFDRQLTGILRKHQLQSSPTSGEPKPKKKKVLFAEPVVSSKLLFKSMPSPTMMSGFDSLKDVLPSDNINSEIQELTKRNRNNLVHQNSTFDKEFDANSVDSSGLDHSDTDSPILFTQFTDNSEESESIVDSCGQNQNSFEPIDPTEDPTDARFSDDSSQDSDSKFSLDQKISSSVDCEPQSSQSSEDTFQCSQVMPESSNIYELSPEDLDNHQSIGIQTEGPEEDPIVMVPMRLSQIRELHQLLGNLLK